MGEMLSSEEFAESLRKYFMKPRPSIDLLTHDIEARDSEWRYRLDVVEGRLEVARKALEGLAYAEHNREQCAQCGYTVKQCDNGRAADCVGRTSRRALTETASTPNPGATPGKETT